MVRWLELQNEQNTECQILSRIFHWSWQNSTHSAITTLFFQNNFKLHNIFSSQVIYVLCSTTLMIISWYLVPVPHLTQLSTLQMVKLFKHGTLFTRSIILISTNDQFFPWKSESNLFREIRSILSNNFNCTWSSD